MRREYRQSDPQSEYFTIEVESAGILRYNKDSWITSAATLQYSKNGGAWTTITPQTGDTGAISVVAGDKIAWKGVNSGLTNSTASYRCSFCASTCTYKISGNIMSLLHGDNFRNAYFIGSTTGNYNDWGTYTFARVFAQCTGLTDASKLALPASASCTAVYYAMFSGCTNLVHAPKEIGLIQLSASTQVCWRMFAGCTSLVDSPEIKVTSIVGTNSQSKQFQEMFLGCTNLVTPPQTLPLDMETTNSGVTDIYNKMFAGCTSLTYGPTLPSTYLNRYCYRGMFSGCTSLTQAPNLPATFNQIWHADSAYEYMFNNCTSLVNAPIMSGAATDNGSHRCMFADCTSLKNVQAQLTAHNIFPYCYEGMFSGCTSLVTAPSLTAATSLTIGSTAGTSCFQNMFRGCTSLKNPPVLPAVSLNGAVSCYRAMFAYCTNLEKTPTLPASTLSNFCYYEMFRGCSSLSAVTTLPATTLANSCYGFMFNGCRNLKTAPVLPALKLVSTCYEYMFTGCEKLNYIKCLASASTTTQLTGCTQAWVSNVASSGTFVKHTNATTGGNGWTTYGGDGIPYGWTIQNATS